MPEASIDRLDIPTRVKLRSTQILTSLPQIISELVQNSLDASATHIDIGVNCAEWFCWVKDNGSGINKEGIIMLGKGSEEGRYRTSKSYAPNNLNLPSTFGFRGEALASAAELSCLEISSRSANSRETWSTIIKGGKGLYSGPAVRWRRESPGTVVCIRDAFYNLPVRRHSHPSATRTLELIRQEIETIALVFTNITFTIESINNERETGSSKGKITRIPKTSSSLAAFRNIYGRALTEHVEEIELKSGGLKIAGFISLNGAYSKSYQFLYVNRHPIARCDLHQVIDSKFASSSFSKNALDEAGETSLPRSTIRRSPRKIEKKPVYVLNLTVPPEEVDNFLEPAKATMHFQDRSALLTFLSSSVQSFLTRHGFSSLDESYAQPIHRDSPSPRKRRKRVFEDSGYAEQIDELELSEEYASERVPQLVLTTDDGPEKIRWTDTNTAETFTVDTRTGNSHVFVDSASGHNENLLHSSQPYLQGRRTISRQTNDPSGAKEVPTWLQQALKANHAYIITEKPIPALKVPNSITEPNMPQLQESRPQQCSCNAPVNQAISSHFQPRIVDTCSNILPHRFQKSDLYSAQVINQVDRKFIACLVEDQITSDDDIHTQDPCVNGRALVLVDQHAADERVRVERFLKDLCLGFLYNRDHVDETTNGILIKNLCPPIPILLTEYEAKRLENSMDIRQAFRYWGFQFAQPPDTGDDLLKDESCSGNDIKYMQVFVQAIPEIISDKLLLGDELRDLVKGFLGQLESEPFLATIPPFSGDSDEFFWLKALRWCPRELLDLINSKACRGAIMFNDVLTISQCEDLIKKLSETAFPFQCAHGRPSLVPLANIGAFTSRQRTPSCVWSKLDE